MSEDLPNIELLRALEPVAEKLINRHLSMTKDWNPHDYIPWSEGKNYYALGGQDWDPDQAKLSDVARVAMVQNLLTEDNLPAYHREIAMNFSMDSAWGYWVNRWTAEENRHGISIRDYLVVTRNCDPVELEELRVEQMTRGFSPGQNAQGDLFAESLFDAVMYVSFQELATRVSHLNTGKLLGDPVGYNVMAPVAFDENMHFMFYRDMVTACLEVDPSGTVIALEEVVREFAMPGLGIPGFDRHAQVIARAGIYDLASHHDRIVHPLVHNTWRIAELTDLDDEAQRARDSLLKRVERLGRLSRRLLGKRGDRVDALA